MPAPRKYPEELRERARRMVAVQQLHAVAARVLGPGHQLGRQRHPGLGLKPVLRTRRAGARSPPRCVCSACSLGPPVHLHIGAVPVDGRHRQQGRAPHLSHPGHQLCICGRWPGRRATWPRRTPRPTRPGPAPGGQRREQPSRPMHSVLYMPPTVPARASSRLSRRCRWRSRCRRRVAGSCSGSRCTGLVLTAPPHLLDDASGGPRRRRSPRMHRSSSFAPDPS